MADVALAYSLLALLIVVITGAIFYLQYVYNQANQQNIGEPPEARSHATDRRTGNSRSNVRARLRARLAERNEGTSDEEIPRETPQISQAEYNESDEDDEDNINLPTSKLAKKKAAKMQKKEEKRMQREMEQKEREEKKELEEKKREEERQREKEEEEEEKRRLEEERKLQEEKERREQEEYEQMRAAFVVEDSGFDQASPEEEKDLLKEFVDHIKTEKVVVLEELASRFKLKTQAVIDRIKDLLEAETLSGVMDDRGKFIYVSSDELNSIAKFIRQRGRVTLSELVEESSTLVSLTTVAE